MPTTLDTIIATAEAKKRDAAAEYRDLVRLLAEGGDADADEVIAIASAAGRTLADLKAAVDHLTARIDAATELAKLPKAAKAEDAANAKLAELQREQEAVIAEMNHRVAEARAARNRASAERTKIEAARTKLFETAPAELKQRRAELDAEIFAAVAWLHKLRRLADDAAKHAAKGLMLVQPEGKPRSRQEGLLPWGDYLKSLQPGSEFAPRWVEITEHARQNAARAAKADIERIRSTEELSQERHDREMRAIVATRERLVKEYTESVESQLAEFQASVTNAEADIKRLEQQRRDVEAEMLKP